MCVSTDRYFERVAVTVADGRGLLSGKRSDEANECGRPSAVGRYIRRVGDGYLRCSALAPKTHKKKKTEEERRCERQKKNQ